MKAESLLIQQNLNQHDSSLRTHFSNTVGTVERVVDEMFQDFSNGLEVQVDQSQLEAKLRSAVELIREDFDKEGVRAPVCR